MLRRMATVEWWGAYGLFRQCQRLAHQGLRLRSTPGGFKNLREIVHRGSNRRAGFQFRVGDLERFPEAQLRLLHTPKLE